MRDQQDRDAMNGAGGLPSHLVAFDPILSRQTQRVTENLSGHLKRNATMLALVGEILVLSHMNRISVMAIM